MRRHGFSLIELVVALSVSTLVLGATLSAYLAATGSWERCRNASEETAEARLALSTIERHLRAALYPGDTGSIVFDAYNESLTSGAAADMLTFTSSAGRLDPGRRQRIDLCQVSLYLTEDEEHPAPMLMMERQPLPGQDPPIALRLEKAPLAPHAVGFNLTYFDGELWSDEWLDVTRLPEAVEIMLAVRAAPEGRPFVLTRLVSLPAAREEEEVEL